MRCKVLLLEAGVVALDEEEKVIGFVKFDVTSMVRSYREVKDGTPSNQLTGMIDRLKSSYDSALTNDGGLARILTQRGFNSSMMDSSEQLALQGKKISIMVNANLAPSEFEANNLLRRFAIDLSSAKVSEVSAKRDLHIIQAVNTLDELDKIINTMGARLREWYGLHFPELDGILQSLNAYCEIVSAGMRGMITDDVLEKAELQERTDILNAARSSRGGVITDENIQALQKLADEIRHLAVVRDNLTAHLEREMDEIAPNIKEILGATIGARMIAKVGSLERLAVLPASTIQVIGAEKALFRALKTGSRPPKHGILFQHPLVHSAPKWQRGKIARAIAAKVVIAARIDAYTGVKNPSLSAKLNERIEEIRQKYSEPVEREHFEETRGREFGGERYGGERGRGGREGRDRGGRERGRDRGRYRHRGKGGRGRDGDRGKERGGRRNERRRRFGRRRR